MNYKQTLDYLFSRLPMFQRIGSAAYKEGLDTTLALSEISGHPHLQFKSIHIAGTNGKGSTSHMLAAIFQKAGYKTGLYTSPHLKDFRERIRINGEMIPEQDVIDYVQAHLDVVEELKPSFFEMTVDLAFCYFAMEKIDIAIVETGLGGRLDSTNIITPELSIITNIGLDHVQLLGGTKSLIAVEKAGIIKAGIPVIIGEMQDETNDVFLKKAHDQLSPISFASEDYTVENIIDDKLFSFDLYENGKLRFKNLELDLTGHYQLKNIKGVMNACSIMQHKGWKLNDDVIREALKNVKKSTGLMGRWQILSQQPLVVCDTGHNEDGLKEVIAQALNTPHQQLRWVFGIAKDKEIEKTLDILPKNCIYYFCKPDIPRCLEAEELLQEAKRHSLKGQAYLSVQAALNAAKTEAGLNDLILVGGSTFVVAEVI